MIDFNKHKLGVSVGGVLLVVGTAAAVIQAVEGLPVFFGHHDVQTIAPANGSATPGPVAPTTVTPTVTASPTSVPVPSPTASGNGGSNDGSSGATHGTSGTNGGSSSGSGGSSSTSEGAAGSGGTDGGSSSTAATHGTSTSNGTSTTGGAQSTRGGSCPDRLVAPGESSSQTFDIEADITCDVASGNKLYLVSEINDADGHNHTEDYLVTGWDISTTQRTPQHWASNASANTVRKYFLISVSPAQLAQIRTSNNTATNGGYFSLMGAPVVSNTQTTRTT